MSVNPDDYEGQTVLIIGRGQSVFWDLFNYGSVLEFFGLPNEH